MQNHLPASLLAYLPSEEDLPALRASQVVLVVLIASLVNVGALFLFCMLRLGIDTYRLYAAKPRHGVLHALNGTVHDQILDLAFLLCALTGSIVLHPSLAFITNLRGLPRANVTILRMLLTLPWKALVLDRACSAIFRRPIPFSDLGIERHLRAIFLVTLSIFVLAMLFLHMGVLLKALTQVFVPWHV